VAFQNSRFLGLGRIRLAEADSGRSDFFFGVVNLFKRKSVRGRNDSPTSIIYWSHVLDQQEASQG